MWCVRNSHKDLRPVWNIFLSLASREISLKLQNLDSFSAIERRKWKSNTYEPDISLLQLLDLKRKHKAALHIWNIDLIRWPWFSFWKQEGRSPNINPWCGQAVTYPGGFFFFFLHVTVVILVDTLARLMKKSGTLKRTMVAQFMKQLCYYYCIISEALCRCFVKHHSVRLEYGSLQTAYCWS